MTENRRAPSAAAGTPAGSTPTGLRRWLPAQSLPGLARLGLATAAGTLAFMGIPAAGTGHSAVTGPRAATGAPPSEHTLGSAVSSSGATGSETPSSETQSSETPSSETPSVEETPGTGQTPARRDGGGEHAGAGEEGATESPSGTQSEHGSEHGTEGAGPGEPQSGKEHVTEAQSPEGSPPNQGGSSGISQGASQHRPASGVNPASQPGNPATASEDPPPAGTPAQSSVAPSDPSSSSAGAQPSASSAAPTNPSSTAPAASSGDPKGGHGRHRHRRAGAGAHARLVSGRSAGARGTARKSALAAVVGAAAAAGPGQSGTDPGSGGSPGGGGRGAHGRHDRAAHRGAPQSSSPVVRTVERIVDVVPEPVWLMIGILALLSVGFAASSWGATLRARRLARQRERLASDVGLLQAALLPAVPERIGPLGISVAYRPAEGPAAGGDFYDVFALDDSRVGVIVGDVSGHGRAALPQTALIRYTLRTYLDSGLAPRAALGAAAEILGPQLDADSHATVAVATVDVEAGVLTYACAGHPAPVVLGAEPVEPVTACASPPIGTGLRTGLRQTVLWLSGPTQICFFTDGLIAAREEGERVGIERLGEMVAAAGPAANADLLLEQLVERTDERPDDMAACVLTLDRTPQRSPVRTEEVELDEAELATDRPRRFLASFGLSEERIDSALSSARGTVDRAGRAILLVAVGPGAPTVDVLARRISTAHSEGLEADGPSLLSSLV